MAGALAGGDLQLLNPKHTLGFVLGGKDYTFYRDQNGVRHDIHNVADYPHKKWKGIIPWLVFRKSGE